MLPEKLQTITVTCIRGASQKVKLAFIEELQINNQAYKLTIAVLHLSDVEENLKERYLIYSN